MLVVHWQKLRQITIHIHVALSHLTVLYFIVGIANLTWKKQNQKGDRV